MSHVSLSYVLQLRDNIKRSKEQATKRGRSRLPKDEEPRKNRPKIISRRICHENQDIKYLLIEN